MYAMYLMRELKKLDQARFILAKKKFERTQIKVYFNKTQWWLKMEVGINKSLRC